MPDSRSLLRRSPIEDDRPEPRPTWQCEFCGRFYSERTAKDHGYCIQTYDRECAEQAGALDV